MKDLTEWPSDARPVNLQPGRSRARTEPLPSVACEVCGEQFVPVRLGVRHCSTFCTKKACRGEVVSPLKTIECLFCGSGFTQGRSIQKYCSLPCQKKANQQKNKKVRYPSQKYDARKAKQSLYRKNYGISLEDFEAIVAEQVFCEICGFGEGDLVPDHNHRNGKFRGALCGPCNRGIGHFMDDPDRLVAAAAYLINHIEGVVS